MLGLKNRAISLLIVPIDSPPSTQTHIFSRGTHGFACCDPNHARWGEKIIKKKAPGKRLEKQERNKKQCGVQRSVLSLPFYYKSLLSSSMEAEINNGKLEET